MNASTCLDCRHYWEPDGSGRPKCAAFPKGIPHAIVYEGSPHIEPYPGDHGLQFEPIALAGPVAAPAPAVTIATPEPVVAEAQDDEPSAD